MATRYTPGENTPCWKRADGTGVPLELLNFPELIAAHQRLAGGEWSGDDSRLLLAAIEAELEARWTRKARRAFTSVSADEDGPLAA